MAKRKIVTEPETGAPKGPPEALGDEPFLPQLWYSREPRTPEEVAERERMDAIWAGLWTALKKPLPRGRRDTSLAARAAAIAVVHYIHERGFPETRKGLLKLIQDYATDKGLPLSDDLRDGTTREIIEAVMESFGIAS
jgi:hypothetical protein